jgi:chromatin segregation and condensation protein Rec8/ScpA/Scc1 (kleisin family)
VKGLFIGIFLALLELMRRGRARVEQAEPNSEIWVLAANSPPDGDAATPPVSVAARPA